MTLLRTIQDAAIDADTSLATLLRKCKVLAARLNNDEFRNWVENELNGYSNIDDLPEYRVMTVNSKGHFSGPFGSGLRNADIPLGCLPEEFQDVMSRSLLMEPVASLEALLTNNDTSTAMEAWSPDLTAAVGRQIYENMNCMQAWKVIPLTKVIAALDSIRNRILNFCLEIEAENPEAGDAPLNSNPVSQEKVSQIFNTYISGNVQNVAHGNTHANQSATYTENDPKIFNDMLQSIADLNKPGKAEIEAAIEEMRDAKSSSQFKEKYKEFMSVLANHMQIFGPVLAPYIPALAGLLP